MNDRQKRETEVEKGKLFSVIQNILGNTSILNKENEGKFEIKLYLNLNCQSYVETN